MADVMRGPCPTCGELFQSRREKIYCSMKCYTGSAEFKERMIEHNRNLNKKKHGETTGEPEEWHCIECGKKRIVVEKRHKIKQFCGRVCYRSWMANRFDRFIANPESIALPQCYDEFLDREELPCLVEGCTWTGKHLSRHCNYVHGITADKLKEMAGFNRTTGLVSKDLAKKLQDRGWNGPEEHRGFSGKPNARKPGGDHGLPVRLEGREHLAKASALNTAIHEANRRHWQSQDHRDAVSARMKRQRQEGTGQFAMMSIVCEKCGTTFEAIRAGKKATTCHECRKSQRMEYSRKRVCQLTCDFCEKEFLGTHSQKSRRKQSLPVYCSGECRQLHLKAKQEKANATEL